MPFVLGPLNGGVPWPKAFDAERRREREWLSYVRGLYKLLPGRRATLKADAIIVGSRYTQSEIPEKFRPRTIYIPENGIEPVRFSLRARHDRQPVRACFIGRMVPYKGPDMLLEAAAPLLLEGGLELDMIGDGPMLGDLKQFAEAQGISESVRFHGWLSHDQVQGTAAECSILAFPSIREFGGGVVVEAMALGLVPLIVDYAGPGELVTEAYGRKVPLGTRAEIVENFGHPLRDLAADGELRKKLGGAGRERVASHFLWSRKAEQVAEVYDWVRGLRSERPHPFG